MKEIEDLVKDIMNDTIYRKNVSPKNFIEYRKGIKDKGVRAISKHIDEVRKLDLQLLEDCLERLEWYQQIDTGIGKTIECAISERLKKSIAQLKKELQGKRV